MGLSKTVLLFSNLMHNCLFKNIVQHIFSFLNYFSRIALKSDRWVSFVVEYILFLISAISEGSGESVHFRKFDL